MKIINSKVHGILDFLVVLFLWMAPSLFNLSEFTGKLAYGLGALHLLLTIVTDFRMGLVKLIPLRVHGLIELAVAVFLVASPWIFDLTGHRADRIFLMVFALVLLLVWVLTNYQEQPVTQEE